MNKKSALIGYSGFVGSTLLRQRNFDELYRSTNIEEIIGKSFSTVICAGAPAVKWLANKHPKEDKKNINQLISNLSNITCDQFILISTVDVFDNPNQKTESSNINTSNLHPYGLHRYELEEFVKEKFNNYLIIRLPGLIGPGLKKNIIYDFLNDNNLESIDSRNIFQFYPMVNLWEDIKIAIQNDIKLMHLTSEPISVNEITEKCFGFMFDNRVLSSPIKYDFQSKYSHIHKSMSYQYSKKEILLAIRSYIQSERLKEA